MLEDQARCIALLEQLRWNGEPVCPYCSSVSSTKFKRELRYHCNDCFTSYSVTVGTLFHRTHIELSKWFIAIELVMHTSPDISIRQLASSIGVNKNTAAYMLTRIRKASECEEKLLVMQILKTTLK